MRKIIIASDHVGISLKHSVCEHLRSLGLEVTDAGPYDPKVSVDYPDYAQKAAWSVVSGEHDGGIVICGTGLGVSIAANKVPGARAALCFDTFTAHQARAHNDSNILALGSWVVTPERSKGIVEEWLKTTYEHGRHVVRVNKLNTPIPASVEPTQLFLNENIEFGVSISLQPTNFAPVLFAGRWQDGLHCAAKAGVQLVELSVRRPEDVQVAELKGLLAELGLRVSAFATGQGCLKDGLCLSAPDPAVRQRAVERMKRIAGFAAEFGAAVIIGGVRGQLTGLSREQAGLHDRAIEAIASCVQAACRCGVRPLIEPINRYETNLINTVEQGLDLLDQIGAPEACLLLDTFHMNIEEVDLAASIRNAGSRLGCLHIADSNRRAPGQGHIDFRAVFHALQAIIFRGPVIAEILPLPNDETALQQTRAYLDALIRPFGCSVQPCNNRMEELAVDRAD